MIRKMEYIDNVLNIIHIEIRVHDIYKIPDSAINKALMIAMNYLMENMETEVEESAD